MTRCPCCNVKLFTLYGIILHLRKHERERKVKSTYHCSICNLSWPTISELDTHAHTVHRKRHSSAEEKLGVVKAAAKPRRTRKKKASTSGSSSGNPNLTSFEFTTRRFPLMEKLYRPTEKEKSHTHRHADSRDSLYFVCDECGMCSVTLEQSNLHKLIHDARRVASGFSSADSSLDDVNIQEHMEKAEFMLMFDMQVAPSSAPESMEQDKEKALAVAEQKKKIIILKNSKNLQFNANRNVVPTVDPNVVKVNLRSRPVASGSGNLINAALIETQKKAGDIQEDFSMDLSVKASPNQRESFKHLEMAVSEMETNPPLPNHTTPGTERYHCSTCGVNFKYGFKLQIHMQSHAESRRDANTISRKRTRGKQTSQPDESSLTVDRGSQPKVVTINESSLEQATKKKNSAVKRNSYADSPHQLSCCFCTRAFSWISSLKRHILTHTGEKPFECDICRARFTLKHSMMRHRRTHTEPNAGGELHENSRQEDDFTEEEINNPNDLVFLKKANECVFAAAEQVRASNLTLGPTPDSFMNRSLSEHTDLLQDLLGVKDEVTIDQMLDSPNTAATLLGIHSSKEEASTA